VDSSLIVPLGFGLRAYVQPLSGLQVTGTILVDSIKVIPLGLCNMSLERIVSPLLSQLYSFTFLIKVMVQRVIYVH
jgi:hypothetical protein